MLPRLLVRMFVAAWLAAIPGGTAIKIAMQKPRAMMTSDDLIFRLEMFLKARDDVPIVAFSLGLLGPFFLVGGMQCWSFVFWGFWGGLFFHSLSLL